MLVKYEGRKEEWLSRENLEATGPPSIQGIELLLWDGVRDGDIVMNLKRSDGYAFLGKKWAKLQGQKLNNLKELVVRSALLE